jgi:hypothetical protein
MNAAPTISVLMSVYNGARFLRSAVESVLAQTCRDFEFIVVDDGSTDGSAELLAGFQDPRLRLARNPDNVGLTRSLNRCLELARGRFIARMDSDDIAHPERFARQLEFLGAHPGIGVLGTAYTNMDRGGRPLFRSSFAGEHGFLVWYLFFQNPIAHPSVMISAEALRKVGGYRPEIRYGQDHDLWWRMAQNTRLCNLPEPLMRLRRHPHSITSLHTAEQQALCARMREEMIPRVLGKKRMAALQSRIEFATTKPGLEAGFILGLREAYTGSAPLSEAERVLISRDAALRLAVLAARHPFDRNTPATLVAAHRLDPLAGLRLCSWPLRRYLGRRVVNCILRK